LSDKYFPNLLLWLH